jgi:hypothetical protein
MPEPELFEQLVEPALWTFEHGEILIDVGLRACERIDLARSKRRTGG